VDALEQVELVLAADQRGRGLPGSSTPSALRGAAACQLSTGLAVALARTGLPRW
jgi:hypothetical protein